MGTQMSTQMSTLDLCRAICGAHAALRLSLDHELGVRHGIDLADFLLLDHLLACPGERAAMTALAAPLGLPRSQLVRQLLALEKTGIVERLGAGGQRQVALRAPGRTVAQLARETVADLCTHSWRVGAGSLSLSALQTGLQTFALAIPLPH